MKSRVTFCSLLITRQQLTNKGLRWFVFAFNPRKGHPRKWSRVRGKSRIHEALAGVLASSLFIRSTSSRVW